MLKVMSNSSPLIHLTKVNLLHLIHNQFNETLVPSLKKIGILGMLIKAKQQGNIPSIRIVLGQLCSSGFRLSEKIYKEVLYSVGEK